MTLLHGLDNKLPEIFYQKPSMIQVLSFTFGGVYVHFDLSVSGVKVPHEHQNADFYVDFCQQNVEIDPVCGLKIAILSKGNNGDSDAVICEVPWNAVYALKYGDEFLVIWVEDLPQEVRFILSESGLIDLPPETQQEDPFLLLSKEVELAVRCAKAAVTLSQSDTTLFCVEDQNREKLRKKVSFSVIPGGQKQLNKPPNSASNLLRVAYDADNPETEHGEEKEKDSSTSGALDSWDGARME